MPKEKGFSLLVIILVLAVLGVLAFFGFKNFSTGSLNNNTVSSSGNTQKFESLDIKAPTTSQIGKSSLPSPDAEYITANPVDLTQIEKISKFRSCAGHDFSGHNFLGQVEAKSSMKHYLKPLPQFQNNKTAAFAPFDGTIHIEGVHPPMGQGERGDSLELMSQQEPNAVFIFFHIRTATDFKHGDLIEAGQLIGYAATNISYDFDLGLRAINQTNANSRFGDTFDSIFNHMTPEVLTQYQKVGLNKENLFVSKEFRDAHPCTFVGDSADNWIILKH